MNEMKKIRLAVLVPTLIIMAIIGAPLHGHAAVDPCSATLSPDLILTMPEVYYNDTFYSVVMQITGTPETTGGFYETEITSMQPMTPNCVTPAVVSDDGISTVLQIPSVLFGSDDYGVELEYVSTAATASVSTRRMAAANPRIFWYPKKVYKNHGVWRGSSTCKYNQTTTVSGVTSTQATTTYASATFACAQPIGLAAFGCLINNPAADESATWKLVSGSILYVVDRSVTGCSVTLGTGQVAFLMKTPDLGDGLIITEKASDQSLLFYSGGGKQNVPTYQRRDVVNGCGVNNFVIVTPVTGETTEWLGFPPDRFALDSGNATILTGTDMLIDTLSSPGLYTISLTCSWNFSFFP